MQQTYESMGMGSTDEKAAEQVKQELEAELEKLEPIKIEKEEDAVKAASAELIESLTVGVAQAAGAEAGEESGSFAAADAAQTAVAVAIEKAAVEVATTVGMEIAGEKELIKRITYIVCRNRFQSDKVKALPDMTFLQLYFVSTSNFERYYLDNQVASL